MADHAKPTSESLAANFAAEIDARLDDITLGLDPATTTPINLPAGAKAWSSAAKNWKKWTGTAWEDLEVTYAIAISGTAGSATKLAAARTVTLNGDVSGSALFDGSSNLTITVTVADDSHSHVISNVDGLDVALSAKLDDSDATVTPTASKIPVASSSGVIDAGWNDPLVAREMRLQAIGINPTLDLDFSRQRYRVYDGAKGLAEIADPFSGLITFTRATTASFFAPFGSISHAGVGTPRIEYDPSSGSCLGLRIESQRVNYLLNSAAVVTQAITVTATAYTLSFYGTGSISLSGAYSGALSGTGSFPDRSTLTFTPRAGSLALTVSGEVNYGQLEAGTFATSYIRTESTQTTRAYDSAKIDGENFSKWYRNDLGSFVVSYSAESDVQNEASGRVLVCASDGTTSNQVMIHRRSNVDMTTRLQITMGSVSAAFISAGTFQKSGIAAGVYGLNNARLCQNGSVPAVDTECEVPACSVLHIGSTQTLSSYINGHVSRIIYFPTALSASQIQELTK